MALSHNTQCLRRRLSPDIWGFNHFWLFLTISVNKSRVVTAMIHAGCILFLLSHISLAKSCYGLGTFPFIFGNCSPTIDSKWELLWYFTVCYFRALASLMQSSSIWKRGVCMNQCYSSAASALERHKNEWNAGTEMCSPRVLCSICTSEIRRGAFRARAAEPGGSYNFTPRFLHFHSHLWWLEHVMVCLSSPKVAWHVFHLLFKRVFFNGCFSASLFFCHWPLLENTGGFQSLEEGCSSP